MAASSTTSTSPRTVRCCPDPSATSGARHTLEVHSIETFCSQDELEPISTFTFGQTIPESFRVLSRRASYLFGSSYYTGISNIFRFEVETGELEAVSNTETGFFRPIPIDNDNLIVFPVTRDRASSRHVSKRSRSNTSAISRSSARVQSRNTRSCRPGEPDPRMTLTPNRASSRRDPTRPIEHIGPRIDLPDPARLQGLGVRRPEVQLLRQVAPRYAEHGRWLFDRQ